MFNIVCTLTSCVQLNLGASQIYMRTPNTVIYQSDRTGIVCVKQVENYNCRLTNNFYNPLDH